ncbi:MAG: restriction endonuclease [Gemmataceae bacterium]
MATAVITANASKYASEYPLPGGVEQYFDTLVAMLRYIRDNNITPDDLFKLLDEGAHNLDDIHEHLKEALDVDWKSKNQTTFRVNWLRSLGYVEKDGREYRLTDHGKSTFQQLNGKAGTGVTVATSPPEKFGEVASSPLTKRAIEIADWLDKVAVAGGDGKEFEEATEAALKFLGFETQLISGSGNPDVLATAAMGEKTYRLLIDSKSRASGTVQQNDVNFQVLEKQKQNASADHVVIVGAGFAGGNLEEFATKNHVRLLSTSEIRELLLAHAQSAFPLDVLRPLFQGGGPTDEGVLSEILTSAESKSEVMLLARKVFAAVKEFQDKAGAIHTDSLYYILKCEHSLPPIKLTVDFLKSDLIGALGETERGSMYTRVSPKTLTNKLSQITRMMDLSELPKT